MKTNTKRTFKKLSVALFLVGVSMVGVKVSGEEETIPLQLLGVNDFHGALDTSGSAYLETDKFENLGRLGNLSVYLDQGQKSFTDKHPNGVTERVQAGDLVGASPANSALLQDEPTVKAFNEMNFTLGVLGNHEFDEGLKEFKRLVDGQAPVRQDFPDMDDDLWKVLVDYPREPLKQEILIANIENKTDGDHGKKGEIPYGFNPYVIKTYGEGEKAVKVAYLGIITKEFPNLVLAKHTEDYKVIDEAETMARYAKDIREQGVNAIVVLSHVAATSSGGEVQGELATIMKKVDELDPENSIDVVFAGHNHQYTNGVIKGKNDVLVVQGTNQGKAVIDVQGELSPKTQDFVKTPVAEVKPVEELGEAKHDPKMTAIVAEADKAIKPITSAVMATADLDSFEKNKTNGAVVTAESNSHNESPLGNLVTDAQLMMVNEGKVTDEKGKPVKADFALTNDGGIRADLVADKDGGITWGAIQTVQPFGNVLQVVALKGADLRSALNEQHKNGKLNYFLQIAGFNYTYHGVGDKFEVDQLTKDDGEAILDDETYHVIINDFLFGGGDGFKSFAKGSLVTAVDSDTDTFVNYFKKMTTDKKKITSPALGRKIENKGDGEKTQEIKDKKDNKTAHDNKSQVSKPVLYIIGGAIAVFLIAVGMKLLNRK